MRTDTKWPAAVVSPDKSFVLPATQARRERFSSQLREALCARKQQQVPQALTLLTPLTQAEPGRPGSWSLAAQFEVCELHLAGGHSKRLRPALAKIQKWPLSTIESTQWSLVQAAWYELAAVFALMQGQCEVAVKALAQSWSLVLYPSLAEVMPEAMQDLCFLTQGQITRNRDYDPAEWEKFIARREEPVAERWEFFLSARLEPSLVRSAKLAQIDLTGIEQEHRVIDLTDEKQGLELV